MRARIRTVKPEALLDEGLWDLEAETGLPTFRGFVGLWMVADREGRFEWRPRAIKAVVLPYWDGDFSRVLDALAARGFIVKYTSGGYDYGLVRTFKQHQIVNNREEDSKLPAPEESLTVSDTSTRGPRAIIASITPLSLAQAEGKGREGKGREGKGREGNDRDAHAPLVEDAPGKTGEPPLLTSAAPWMRLWKAWERVSANGLPCGDGKSHESRLTLVWEACVSREAKNPVGVFERAARAFLADCAARGQRPNLIWLCSQFGTWTADVAPKTNPATAEDARLARRAAEIKAETARIDAELAAEALAAQPHDPDADLRAYLAEREVAHG